MSTTHANEIAATGRAASSTEAAHQVELRMKVTDVSSRAIVSNVTAVQTGTGMVFIDFGFVEQQAFAEMKRALRAGEAVSGLDGRLECRVAMGVADVAQLIQQLQQVLASSRRQSAVAQEAMDASSGSSSQVPLQ